MRLGKVSNGIIAVLLMLIFLFSVSGCNKSGEQTGEDGKIVFKGAKIDIVKDGVSDYVIVRSKECTDYEMKVARDLNYRLQEMTGAGLRMTTDTRAPENHAIIIGAAKGANEGLAEGEYVVKYENENLIITAGSDKALKLAYDFFLFQFLDCKWGTPAAELKKTANFSVPKNLNHKDKYLTREEQLAQTALIKYPEYPEDIIPRDYDYTVRVIQGEKVIELPVYNPVYGSNYFSSNVKDHDLHRRYAEFAFSGDPVTVEITVNNDFRSYSVMPSSKQIPSQINGNVITYTLTEPQTTVFKINEDRDTHLTIFAEEPPIEEDIPNKDDPNVIYFEAGYHEVEGGALHLSSSQTVYLEPGALVRARVKIIGGDVRIYGKGAFLESSPTRMSVDGVNYMCSLDYAKNVTIEDVRFLDAHTFNIVAISCEDFTMKGVKVLSNQISTDGLSVWSTGKNIHADDCYWNISDNIFVIGVGKIDGLVVENSICITDYAFLFPQGDLPGGTQIYKNLDVLKGGRFLDFSYNGESSDKKIDLYMENVYSVDADMPANFFMNLSNVKNGKKKFVFKNVSVPQVASGNNVIKLTEEAGNISVTVDNVWIGDKQFTSLDGVKHNVDTSKNINFTFTDASDKDAVFVGKENIVRLDKPYVAEKVYIGSLKVESKVQPYTENGTTYLSIMEVLKKLDFTDVAFDGEKLTFKYGDESYEVKAGSTDATKNGSAVTLSAAPVVKGDRLMVSTSFFSEMLGTETTYNAAKKSIVIKNIDRGGNLLKNPGMEQGLTTDWMTRNFTDLYLSNDAHSGSHSIRMFMNTDSYSYSNSNGIYQDVLDTLRRYGMGRYKVTAWVKKAGADHNGQYVQLGITSAYDIGATTKVNLTDEWQKVEYYYSLTGDPTNLNGAFLCVGYADGTTKNILVDDISMEKVK